jgi:4-hydroxy-3-methylbut-2-en-1-yl diphosphate synthase IspG/GcpE
MQLSELAEQLRRRLLDRGLAKASTLHRVSDRAIVPSYITCPSCGKRQVEDTKALARIIALADSADTFFELCDAHSQHKH